LRAAILDLAVPAQPEQSRRSRWRTTVLAAVAAAIVAGATVVGVEVLTRPAATRSVADQIMGASDVRTVSGKLGDGTATVVFSRNRNAGVLVMNNVPPPKPGTVYQMWLIGDKGATSAGTMDTAAVAPSTTATLADLGGSKALAFTVEPGTGSSQPTSAILAELPLS
jgi:anti-sigma-K factor RskA